MCEFIKFHGNSSDIYIFLDTSHKTTNVILTAALKKTSRWEIHDGSTT